MAADDDDLDSKPITRLYEEMRNGNKQAENDLFECIYAPLNERARAILWGSSAGSAVASLVHDAYLKLSRGLPEASDRIHLLNLMSRIMRQTIVDGVRKRQAQKRAAIPTSLSSQNVKEAALYGHASQRLTVDKVLALDQALTKVAAKDAEGVRFFEMYFFVGWTIDEIAFATDRPRATVAKIINRARVRIANVLGT
jgi:RNA polymerase sigma-70 factor (ECF subfamily)